MTKLKTGLLILGLGWGLGPIAADAALPVASVPPIAGGSMERVPPPVEAAAAQLQAACRAWPVTDDFLTDAAKRPPAPLSDTALDDRSLCNDVTGKGFQLTHWVILGILAIAFFALAGLVSVFLSVGQLLRAWLWRFNDWCGRRRFS